MWWQSQHNNKTTGKEYKIFCNVNCKTPNVVYLLNYHICGSQYVGESVQPFSERMNGHRSDLTKKTLLPVSQHFVSPGHSLYDFGRSKIYIIDHNPSWKENQRQKRKSFRIRELQTLSLTSSALDHSHKKKPQKTSNCVGASSSSHWKVTCFSSWYIVSWHLLDHATKSVSCFNLQFWRSTRPMTSFCIFIAYINTGNSFQRQNYKMRLKQRSLNWINSMQV
jgi:hypothetical protein